MKIPYGILAQCEDTVWHFGTVLLNCVVIWHIVKILCGNLAQCKILCGNLAQCEGTVW